MRRTCACTIPSNRHFSLVYITLHAYRSIHPQCLPFSPSLWTGLGSLASDKGSLQSLGCLCEGFCIPLADLRYGFAPHAGTAATRQRIAGEIMLAIGDIISKTFRTQVAGIVSVLVPSNRVVNIDALEAVTKTPFLRHTCHDEKDESQDRARSQMFRQKAASPKRESKLHSSKFSLHFTRKQPIRKECCFRSLIRSLHT